MFFAPITAATAPTPEPAFQDVTLDAFLDALDEQGYHRVMGKEVLDNLRRCGRDISGTYYGQPDGVFTVYPAGSEDHLTVGEEEGVLIVGDEVCATLADALAVLD